MSNTQADRLAKQIKRALAAYEIPAHVQSSVSEDLASLAAIAKQQSGPEAQPVAVWHKSAPYLATIHRKLTHIEYIDAEDDLGDPPSAPQAAGEVPCPGCHGSGDMRALDTSLGPDADYIDVECSLCGGTGNAPPKVVECPFCSRNFQKANHADTRANDQGDAQDGRSDAGAAGRALRVGANKHHEHRARKSTSDIGDSSEDRGGSRIQSEGEVRAPLIQPPPEEGWANEPLDEPQEWFSAHALQVREQAALPAAAHEALTLAREYVASASLRGYDGTNGHAIRQEAKRRLALIDAALAQGTTPAAGVGEQATGVDVLNDIANATESWMCEAGARQMRSLASDALLSPKQAQAEPMSDETIVRVFNGYSSLIDFYKDRGINFARAILAEAGIKEKT